MALVSALATGSWPTRSLNCCGRYRRATTVYSRPGSVGAGAGGDLVLAIKKEPRITRITRIKDQISKRSYVFYYSRYSSDSWLVYGLVRAVARRIGTGRSGNSPVGSASGGSRLPAAIFSTTSSPRITFPTIV